MDLRAGSLDFYRSAGAVHDLPPRPLYFRVRLNQL
jgi:hypothetical protein